MKLHTLAATISFTIALLSNTYAQTVPVVGDISDIKTFETTVDTGSTPRANINIRQFSSTDKTGDGEFVLNPSGRSSDHGAYLNDHHNPIPNCYYRQFYDPGK